MGKHIVWRVQHHMWQKGPGGVSVFMVPGRSVRTTVVEIEIEREEPNPQKPTPAVYGPCLIKKKQKPKSSVTKNFIYACLKGGKRATIQQLAEASEGRFTEGSIHAALHYHRCFCAVGWADRCKVWALRDEIIASADHGK